VVKPVNDAGIDGSAKLVSLREEQLAFVCIHVFEARRPVRLVSHEDGEWQLLCGGAHDPGETPRVVGFHHLIERDPSLQELLDLPPDWDAERESVESPWVRTPSGGSIS